MKRDDRYAIMVIAHDSSGRATRCASCGKTPARTAFARPDLLPFGGKEVWEMFVLCEDCSHKAIAESGKLRLEESPA